MIIRYSTDYGRIDAYGDYVKWEDYQALESEYDILLQVNADLGQDYVNLTMEVERLVEALEFYANKDNYRIFEVANQKDAITDGGISKEVAICAEQALPKAEGEKVIHFGGEGCRRGGTCMCGYHTEDFTEWSNHWERVTCQECLKHKPAEEEKISEINKFVNDLEEHQKRDVSKSELIFKEEV